MGTLCAAQWPARGEYEVDTFLVIQAWASRTSGYSGATSFPGHPYIAERWLIICPRIKRRLAITQNQRLAFATIHELEPNTALKTLSDLGWRPIK